MRSLPAWCAATFLGVTPAGQAWAFDEPLPPGQPASGTALQDHLRTKGAKDWRWGHPFWSWSRKGKHPDGPEDGDDAPDAPPGGPHQGHGDWHDGPRHHGMHHAAGHAIQYFPGLTIEPGRGIASNMRSSSIALGRESRTQVADWFSVGKEGHTAIQLFPGPGQGNWVSPYAGFIPRLGFTAGPVRLDLGLLAGVGGMLRTTTTSVGADFLQARLMWVLEPRLEAGFGGEHLRGGLVAGYLLTPHMKDVGGLSVGVQLRFGPEAHARMNRKHPDHHGKKKKKKPSVDRPDDAPGTP